MTPAAPKRHTAGTHRMVSPEETLARALPLMPVMGITRIANITGLDAIGIPVTMVSRPNARSLAVSQGKGLDLVAAKVSGLMESIEGYHAERIGKPVKLATYEELRYTHAVVDVDALPRARAGLFDPHATIPWIEGIDLVAHEPVWLPFDCVSLDFTTAARWSHSGCLQSSNGLASGNHVLEAIEHGISEIVERDAVTMWRLSSAEEQAGRRIDPASVDDDACRSVLARYAAADVAVGIWDVTSDVGVPAFQCRIVDAHDQPFRRLGFSEGMGCHPTRGIALLRALTEAAQSRLTLIAGARDDTLREHYLLARSPDRVDQHREDILRGRAGRAFASVPDVVHDSFDADVAWELDRLRGVGIDRVVVVDLTKPEFGIPVVRVVIPGLEALAMAGHWVPGARAKRGRAS